MKRRAKIIQFSNKDDESIFLSKSMTPEERIILMFQLIELSSHLKPQPSIESIHDDLPFITVRKKTK